ncbi:MAG: SpoIIIAH-like family protein [Clostridia bacterium]|nr:SpoIIIAH-like family protein [Clostridia bacterium]
MKIIKKNELTILVIALMLVTAGYLDYIGKNKTEQVSSEIINQEELASNPSTEEEIAKIGDAKLVSDNQEQTQEVFSEEENNDGQKKDEKEDDGYFVSAKLDRTNMYSQVIENYQKIIENPNVSEEQKAITTQEIARVNKEQNSVMISENLLLAKGFDKCIIFINDKSVSVIIGKQDLSQEEIAQIQNIISRELEADADNIHISVK